jgi:hypothetical protein
VGEAGQDFVNYLGPNEGLGTMIRGLGMTGGGLIQLPPGAMHATPNLLFGQGGEPAHEALAPFWAQLQRRNQSP